MGNLLKGAGNFLLDILVSCTAVTKGMLTITNGSEIGRKVCECCQRFVGLCQSLPIFYYNISCPLHCSCAAPETSCLNNLLLAGQDRTCPTVLSGGLINPLTEKHRQSKAVLQLFFFCVLKKYWLFKSVAIFYATLLGEKGSPLRGLQSTFRRR